MHGRLSFFGVLLFSKPDCIASPTDTAWPRSIFLLLLCKLSNLASRRATTCRRLAPFSTLLSPPSHRPCRLANARRQKVSFSHKVGSLTSQNHSNARRALAAVQPAVPGSGTRQTQPGCRHGSRRPLHVVSQHPPSLPGLPHTPAKNSPAAENFRLIPPRADTFVSQQIPERFT